MNNPPKSTQAPKPKKGKAGPKKGKKQRASPFASKTSERQSVAANYSKKVTTGKPNTTHLPNGDVIVEHSEFIKDLNGSVGFAVVAFAVNPGQQSSFPWLSQIAPNYESYIFERLNFRYENIIGSTASGTTMLGVDYDASDPPPTDKTQFASYQDYARDAPWKCFTQYNRRENIRKRTSYYVRTGPLPASTDIKLYDVGNLFAGTQGMVDTSLVGEIYVDYKVRFMTPQIQNPGLGTSKSASVTIVSDVVSLVANSNAPIVPSGNAEMITITATGAYDCIVTGGLNAASGAGITLSGTAVRQAPSIVPNALGTQTFFQCQVSFLPGQTLIIDNTGTTPGNGTVSFGQFNTSLL